MILTTTDINNMLPVMSRARVAELCRSKHIYAWKDSSPFATWQIPVESFAMFLRYNPILKSEFMTEEDLEWWDNDMKLKVNKVRDILNGRARVTDETYKLSNLIRLFGSDITAWLRKEHYISYLAAWNPKLAKPISALVVTLFLHNNRKHLDRLRGLHGEMLATNDPDEAMVRHMLMLYAYYESNGYFM